MSRFTCILPAILCLLILPPIVSAEPVIWFADPLEKIFPDTPADSNYIPFYEAAAGEHATFQVVVRSSEKIDDLTVKCSDFVNDNGNNKIKPTSIRFVGFVPVDKPTHRLPKKPLRKIPSLFPDPLMEYNCAAVKADISQPVWVTVKIPTKTQAGIYHANITLSIKTKSEKKTVIKPVEIKVFNVQIDKSRLWVTNWFSVQDTRADSHLELAHENESEGYYKLLRKYAADMAAHRQNIALIPVFHLTNFNIDDAGELKADFTRFDKWVDIFIEEGVIGKIEGAHLGYAPEGFDKPFEYMIRTIVDGNVVYKLAKPQDPDCQKFYSVFMPALVEHLKEKGWLDIYIQHIADEPTKKNKKTYIPIAKIIREYAPQLKIAEACYTEDLVGYIDVWCPKLPNFDKYFDFYSKRTKMNEEVWFYTSVSSQDEYANRFIEMHLIKTRLIHWINFKFGATGFLHWGYNHWTHMGNKQSPYIHTVVKHPPPYKYLPAGDAWIIYPGKDGPVDSIRFEAMRDGIADYELLKMLEEKAPEAAKELADRLIMDFDKYNIDIKIFRQTRRELLELLEKYSAITN